jgi:hypothetical protein
MMAEITAAAVKNCASAPAPGMMDCKKALTEEVNGDMEAAVDWLRAKGLAAAAKKSSRTAAEGLVGVAVAAPRALPSKSTARPTSSPRTTSSRISCASDQKWRSARRR